MKHATIDYDLGTCGLGRLLVAGTTRGVCFVRLGEGTASLEDQLKHEFPYASVRRAGIGPVRSWRTAVERYLRGASARLDVPLDVRGSVFQRRVWAALASIPRGETRSYGALAAELGTPRASRAVARACASNPAWVVTPCHRVIAKDGGLAGYAGGIDRKRALLELEGALASVRAAG
jgi:AraC family transcriptional regulator of adaptative response/methylated-DNA-[protein]-cysteine methyltransferase